MAVEDEIDRLYGLPLGEFVTARNELARTLRKEGDREAAELVKGLAKPTVSAWAVNQLARREPGGVRRLLACGDRLRKAQTALLKGGSPDELRQASEMVRDAVAELTPTARRILESPSDAVLDRIAETLRSAAVAEDGRELLERGRLDRDVESVGFGPLPASLPERRPPAKGEQAPREAPARPQRDRRRERAEAKVRDVRAEVTELERQVREAEAQAKAARRAADEAERAAERERTRLEKAAARLARAEEELRAAR
jgi:hypothetical protein